MLCWFLPYIIINQSQVYICSLTLEPLPTSQPIPPLWVVTECRAELPVLHSSFPLAICFAYANVHVSVLLSQFIPPSLSPAVSLSLFSMSESLFLPYKQVHQHYLSGFHMCMLICDIVLFLTYITLWNRLQVHPPHQNRLKFIPSYG